LLITCDEIDELLLKGRGGARWAAATAWFVAALALAGPPFLGTFTGHALIDDAASVEGYWWVPAVIAFATIGATAAIVRAGARVFLGWGERQDPLLSEEPSERSPPGERPRLGMMQAVTLTLAVAGLAVGAFTGLAVQAVEAAHHFVDREGYARAVLDHRPLTPAPPEAWHTTTASLVWATVTLVGSFALGYASLYRGRLPQRVTDVLAAGLAPLRALHSGHVGDYVAWLTFGTAVIGGVFALTLH
jgi:multicomponent Na+:H+ antiporter subunit D